ncbi:MAG: Cof-type HAD-IIB family hydrolase [Proteobacteria bacterium]|nr:Cof-type HAD-IIB family hydrolase [Pseudomonadota bacterium]
MTQRPKQCLANYGKRLFITDLDGTLLNDHRQIAPENLAALTRMRRAGITVALATGRSNYSLAMLMEKLGYDGPESVLPVDYIIFSTGAGVMDYPGGRIMRSVSLALEDVLSISSVLEQLGLDYMAHMPVPDTAHFLYSQHHQENPDFLRRLDIYKSYAAPLTPAALAAFGGATEVLCIVPGECGHEIAARLTEIFKQFSVIKATSPLDGKSLWIEIFAPAVSKSQAARWLVEELSIKPEMVCAVGNDYNDEDLLHWAGESFVVANSPQVLQTQFQTVASNNHGGIAEAVARWLAW